MDLGLADRVYVVTGGSKGLGLRRREALVAEGARVVVSSRSAESVEAAVAGSATTRGASRPTTPIPTALRVPGPARARRSSGRLDGALISVGGPPGTDALGATDEQWRERVRVGVPRRRALARAVVPHLDSGGAIGLVLSTSSKSPIGGLAISNGLRPGLAMWAKQLADELGPQGIRVVGLMPGRVLTDRIRRALADQADRDRDAATVPLRRLRTLRSSAGSRPSCSPAASYLTGCVIPVDGGSLRALWLRLS